MANEGLLTLQESRQGVSYVLLVYVEVIDAEFDPITWKGIIDGTFFLRLECNDVEAKL